MGDKNIIRTVIKFDFNKYRDKEHIYTIETTDGKPVNFVGYYNSNVDSGKKSFLGIVAIDDKTNQSIEWDEDGNTCIPEISVMLVNEEVKNYDNITSEDVPDTPEFKSDLENAKWTMGPVEYLRYKAFCQDHRKCVKGNGAIGGGISVEFMGTGLGPIITMHCRNCGTNIDITDESCW